MMQDTRRQNQYIEISQTNRENKHPLLTVRVSQRFNMSLIFMMLQEASRPGNNCEILLKHDPSLNFDKPPKKPMTARIHRIVDTRNGETLSYKESLPSA